MGKFCYLAKQKTENGCLGLAEAEFRAMTNVMREGMRLKCLLSELNIQVIGTINMMCESQVALSIAKNSVRHDRTKHVEIDGYFIKENLEGGIINISYVFTIQQREDIWTKMLAKTNFEDMRSKLGLHDIYCLT